MSEDKIADIDEKIKRWEERNKDKPEEQKGYVLPSAEKLESIANNNFDPKLKKIIKDSKAYSRAVYRALVKYSIDLDEAEGEAKDKFLDGLMETAKQLFVTSVLKIDPKTMSNDDAAKYFIEKGVELYTGLRPEIIKGLKEQKKIDLEQIVRLAEETKEHASKVMMDIGMKRIEEDLKKEEEEELRNYIISYGKMLGDNIKKEYLVTKEQMLTRLRNMLPAMAYIWRNEV